LANFFSNLQNCRLSIPDLFRQSASFRFVLSILSIVLIPIFGMSQSVTIEGPGTVEAAETASYQFQVSGIPSGYTYESHKWSGATFATGSGSCGGNSFKGSTTVPIFQVKWGGGNSSVTMDNIGIKVKYIKSGSPEIEILASRTITIRRVSPFIVSGPTNVPQCCLTEKIYQAVGYSDQVDLSGYSFNWTVPPGWGISNGQGTPNITVNPDNTSGGQVTCTVFRTFGGCSILNSASVSRSVPSLGINYTGNNIFACVGQVFTFNSSIPCGNPALTWSVPQGWNIISGQNTPTVTISPTPSAQNGALTISGTFQGGCIVNSASRNLELLVEEPPNPTFLILNPQNDMPHINWINGRWHVCPNGVVTILEVHPIRTAQSYTFSVSSPWSINGQSGPITTTNPWISVSGPLNAPISGVLTVVANNCIGSSDPVNYTFLRNDTRIPCGNGGGGVKAMTVMNEAYIEEPTVYPNPFTQSFQIDLPTLQEWTSWDMMDISGRIVKSGNLADTDQTIVVDTKELQSGMYLIRMHTTKDNSRTIIKAIKM